MKATFDFIPAYCPSCGKPLFKPPEAEYRTTGAAILEDYQNGQPYTCDKCGLAFQKEQPQPEPATVHYWPGSQSNVTQCGLDLRAYIGGHGAGPIMTADKDRITCGNCRRLLGL